MPEYQIEPYYNQISNKPESTRSLEKLTTFTQRSSLSLCAGSWAVH